ncbi:quinone oxidoreductase putative [Glonium stellatum]|uniref:Quinone oxidoreductase putative n=1 Tax=Glonium stellatum TaxID=574774 RepID=A0A8E2FCB8_9PEZI|nr:quinone oxidoreductase putative [Glonium stellatum]
MPETMRAVDIKGDVGSAEALYITDIPKPHPKGAQALVRVKAFGINRADIMQRDGEYPAPPQAGRILGLEFAGVIETLGEDHETSFKIGDEAFGLVYGGAYAEYVVVSTHMLIHKPANLSWEECAGIPETWLTATKVMYQVGEFTPGKSILWHAGASGVSISGIQLAIANGASAVYATARSDAKCDFCVKTLGCTAAFKTTDPNWADEALKVTDGKGVDIIADLIGPAVFAGNLKIAARDARVVLIGLMSGFKLKEEVDMGLLAFKRIRYEGSTLRSRNESYQRKLKDSLVEHALPKFEAGLFKVYVEKVFPWEQVVDAHKFMESNTIMGKIICTIR